MLREEIITRLKEIDKTIYFTFGNKCSFKFIIVGGSELILNYESFRGTPNIDVIDLDRKIIDIAEKFDMNCRVNAYIFNFAYNFEDRLIEIKDKDFKVSSFYTLSLEDIVISKLAAYRKKDIEDISSQNVLKKINWNKLIKIIEVDKEFEMSNISQKSISDFMFNYEKYKKEHYNPK